MAAAGPRELAGVVLAAGAGRRFGGGKQLARVGGEALVARMARIALDCCPAGVMVVTGSHADRVQWALRRLPVGIARNCEWRSGMAGSLRHGLASLGSRPAAVMILLSDQPAVSRVDLRRLAAAWRSRPSQVAAARYGTVVGVPAVFPRRYWSELRRLRGERGARQVIAAASGLSLVEMPSAALDVDRPGDLPRAPADGGAVRWRRRPHLPARWRGVYRRGP
jgi:CTP:molybdopterin cytidylyltransferase MocA